MKTFLEGRRGEGPRLFSVPTVRQWVPHAVPAHPQTTVQHHSFRPCVTKRGYLTCDVRVSHHTARKQLQVLNLRSVPRHHFTGRARVFITVGSRSKALPQEILDGGMKPGRARCLGSQARPEGMQGGPEGGVGCLWESLSSLVTWNCPSLRGDLHVAAPTLSRLISGLSAFRRRSCLHPAGLPLPSWPGPSKGGGLTLGPGGQAAGAEVGGGRMFFSAISRGAEQQSSKLRPRLTSWEALGHFLNLP